MSELTPRIHSALESMVQEHFGDEAIFFDQIWETFWKRLNCTSIEELSSVPNWNVRSTTGRALGAIGDASGQALDTLYLLSAVVGAAIVLVRDHQTDALDLGTVHEVIRREADRVEAPRRVRDILEKSGSRMLAEQFGVSTTQPEVDHQSDDVVRYKVEWCELDEADQLIHSQEIVALDDAHDRFQSARQRFTLFVDESRRLIQVRGGANCWKFLQARHRKYLHLILQSLRRGGTLRYSQVAQAMGDGDFVDDTNIRRLKSETNEKLNGVLDKIMHVQKGLQYYDIEPMFYCWIRYDGQNSLLISDRR